MMTKSKERYLKKGVIDKLRQGGVPSRKQEEEVLSEEEPSLDKEKVKKFGKPFSKKEEEEDMSEPDLLESFFTPKKKNPNLSPDKVEKFGKPFSRK